MVYSLCTNGMFIYHIGPKLQGSALFTALIHLFSSEWQNHKFTFIYIYINMYNTQRLVARSPIFNIITWNHKILF